MHKKHDPFLFLLTMILKKITLHDLDQEYLWSVLLNETVRFGKSYKNPLRPDKEAGCKFLSKDGALIFMDYSKEKGYDIVGFYSSLRGVLRKDAYQQLYDLQKRGGVICPIGQSVNLKRDISCKIRITSESYSEDFLNYWKLLKVKKQTLLDPSNKVFEVSSYTLMFPEISRTYYPKDLVFAYQGERGLKLYFPERKKPRFKSSLDKNDIWVFTQNPKKWIIAKSHKDFLVIKEILIRKNLDYSLGMVQSEGSFPEREDWKNAEILIPFFDNDRAGKEGSENFKNYYKQACSIFLPENKEGDKDISDWLKSGKSENILIKLLC